SSWLGPPRMNSRTHAMPCLRSSAACRLIASFQPSAPRPAAPADTRRKKLRRLSTPSRPVRRCSSDCQVIVDVLCPLTLGLELGRVEECPQDVFKSLGPVADLFDVALALLQLLVGRLAGQGAQVDHADGLAVLRVGVQDAGEQVGPLGL